VPFKASFNNIHQFLLMALHGFFLFGGKWVGRLGQEAEQRFLVSLIVFSVASSGAFRIVWLSGFAFQPINLFRCFNGGAMFLGWLVLNIFFPNTNTGNTENAGHAPSLYSASVGQSYPQHLRLKPQALG